MEKKSLEDVLYEKQESLEVGTSQATLTALTPQPHLHF